MADRRETGVGSTRRLRIDDDPADAPDREPIAAHYGRRRACFGSAEADHVSACIADEIPERAPLDSFCCALRNSSVALQDNPWFLVGAPAPARNVRGMGAFRSIRLRITVTRIALDDECVSIGDAFVGWPIVRQPISVGAHRGGGARTRLPVCAASYSKCETPAFADDS